MKGEDLLFIAAGLGLGYLVLRWASDRLFRKALATPAPGRDPAALAGTGRFEVPKDIFVDMWREGRLRTIAAGAAVDAAEVEP